MAQQQLPRLLCRHQQRLLILIQHGGDGGEKGGALPAPPQCRVGLWVGMAQLQEHRSDCAAAAAGSSSALAATTAAFPMAEAAT